MYQLIRKIFFWFPPEPVHHFSMSCLRLVCSIPPLRSLMRRIFRPKSIPVHFSGLNFRNPVGLGAGFDKNAQYLRELEALGFGFVEIGTVTPLAQPGNEKPRVFRLPSDKGLINRMGFNNDGLDVVVSRLKKWRADTKSQITNSKFQTIHIREDKLQPPTSNFQHLLIGGNIGKNKITPNELAWTDYVKCFNALHPYVDFFTVNVSSPNTPGLRELQEKESLRKILVSLQDINKTLENPRPIFLKIAPDLSHEQLDDVIALAKEIHLDGLVATNTTISREGLKADPEKIKKIGAGGLSGKPVQARSTEVLKYICSRTNGQIPVMASGGIFTTADAKEKMSIGAGLVQVWTGFIYMGPAIVKKICRGL